ncbi:hypothetical protein [Chakrabartyella piscis]|uniref:hypothetical protein n=1 Tax=Chakrabartyella piscis TaxID=2918914 RepID=UPI002958C10E|nr:hypothetical protein [Chakrabartyella piscis]
MKRVLKRMVAFCVSILLLGQLCVVNVFAATTYLNRLTLIGNGGTFEGAATKVIETDYTDVVRLLDYSFQREGYTLSGWSANQDGSGDFYYPNDTHDPSGTKTIINGYYDISTYYAQWEEATPTGSLTIPAGETLVAVNTRTTDFEYSDDFATGAESTGVIPASTANTASAQEIEGLSEENLMGYDSFGKGLLEYDTKLFWKNDFEEVDFELFETNNFSVGDKRDFTLYYNGSIDVEFEVLTTSGYCNVWVPTTALQDYILTKEQANELAEEYDDKIYPSLLENFGGVDTADVDNDGKVNLICYDIQNDGAYATAYVGGFFHTADINNDGIDTLHVDSAQGIRTTSWGSTTVDVSNCFSTVAHELQHMIAYCVGMVQGSYMPTFINEAFSMSAEHMLYGTQTSRITYYNTYSNIQNGQTSLSCWGSSGNTLDHYALSYLFGQYVRTQYMQQVGVDDGDVLYKDFFAKLKVAKYSEMGTFELLADMVGAGSSETLLMNFYTALLEKEDSGAYGFGGESWANSISPKYVTGDSASLVPGAAVYFDAYASFTPEDAGEHIVFVPLGVIAGNPVVDIATTVSDNTTKVEIGCSGFDGTVFCALYDESGKFMDMESVACQNETWKTHTVTLDGVGVVEAFGADAEYKPTIEIENRT